MENQIKLRAVGDDFGEGQYLGWKDGETKKVKITNWGVYDKKDDTGKSKISFRCDVLKVDDVDYAAGQKVVDTTSINFHKAIKPLLAGKDMCKMNLKIARVGEGMNTKYLMELIR